MDEALAKAARELYAENLFETVRRCYCEANKEYLEKQIAIASEYLTEEQKAELRKQGVVVSRRHMMDKWQELRNTIAELQENNQDKPDVVATMHFLLNLMHVLEAQDGEGREAHWIKMTGMMPPELTGHYQCSDCGWHGKHDKEDNYLFCPMCGAKMGGVDEHPYPCIACCSPSERAACCGCPTEKAWKERYGADTY